MINQVLAPQDARIIAITVYTLAYTQEAMPLGEALYRGQTIVAGTYVAQKPTPSKIASKIGGEIILINYPRGEGSFIEASTWSKLLGLHLTDGSVFPVLCSIMDDIKETASDSFDYMCIACSLSRDNKGILETDVLEVSESSINLKVQPISQIDKPTHWYVFFRKF